MEGQKIMEKLKTLIPINKLDELAQTQIRKNLELPFLEKMAIMPDCHAGYTLPIGAVALLDGVISPDYVGYDIGCGMCCFITDIDASDILFDHRSKDQIFKRIYKEIPMISGTHKFSNSFESASGDPDLNKKIMEKYAAQLGTLGGGNHFIEIGKNLEKKLAITIHSGSRNPGHSIAGYYMKKSREEDTDLPDGFFHLDSKWGKRYLYDMKAMMDYAHRNRTLIMLAVLNIMEIMGQDGEMINETHNHAIVDGTKVLHRKGATSSLNGQLGVIPANMRDGVYVVKGLGNEEFLSSSSHGAGRRGSRKWAKTQITLDEFGDMMSDAGVMSMVTKGTLDESPIAYKDIGEVMRLQENVVIESIDYIQPIINIKNYKMKRGKR